MASSSIDAAARINEIIDRVQNLATLMSDDARAFGTQAIRALDGLAPIESVAPFSATPPPYIPAVLPPPLQTPPAPLLPTAPKPPDMPPLPTAPDFEELLRSLDTDMDIETRLESGLATFLDTYFPRSDSDAGIERLLALSAAAEGGLAAMQRRFDDHGAVTYLTRQLSGTEAAKSRMAASIEGGGGATGYLIDRAQSGASATTYLLTKFRQGDAATTRLLDLMLTEGAPDLRRVEDQIWQRDRGRITSETRKQKQSVVDSWAARGYPLPTGGAAMAVMMIESEGQDRIAQSSRERAIKDVEIMIENVKFAANLVLQDASSASRALMEDASGSSKTLIDDARAATQLTIENAREAAKLLLDDSMAALRAVVDAGVRAAEPLARMRGEAISAAIEYMRGLALGPQLKADLIKTQISGHSAAARAITDFYQAEISANTALFNAEVALSSLMVNAQVTLAGQTLNAEVSTSSANLQALTAIAGQGLQAQLGMADLSIKPGLANAQNQTQLVIEANRTVTAIAQAKSQAALGAAKLVGEIASSALTSLNASAILSQNS